MKRIILFASIAILARFPAPAAAAGSYFITNQNAVVAIGQQNFASTGVNGTSGVGAAGMVSPSGVWSDGSTLIVADTGNNRVLIYNSVPVFSGTPADIVLGQLDAVSNSANQGGSPGPNTLNAPTGVFFDYANLYIADTGNNRVLIFNSLPSADNTPADLVVGQAAMTANAANPGGVSNATLSSPSAVFSDGNSLYVADRGNNRVLIYNRIPTSSGQGASVAVGQVLMSSGAANQGGTASSKTLSSPAGVFSIGTSLFVADSANNRVLIYNPIPTANGAPAAVAVGQAFLTSTTANGGGSVNANTLAFPTGVFSDGTRLFVADKGNNRALIYGVIPSSNNASAAVAVGQPNLTSNKANEGVAAGAATLSAPAAVYSDGTALYIADQSNHRTLIYSTTPASNNAPASVAVGQSDLISAGANQALSVAAANTQFFPTGVFFDGTRIFVADKNNNRVLIYKSVPSANNASADIAVGQASLSTNSPNSGGAVSSSSLFSPAGAFSDGTRLFVADQRNNRVLIYNPIPAASGQGASVAVGQVSMSSGAVNQNGPVGAKTLAFPAGVHYDGARLFVADRFNNRVLMYSPLPASNGRAATLALGQMTLTTNAPNQGGRVTAKSLSSPTGVFSDGTRLFVSDQLNHRVLIYNFPLIVSGQAANVVVGQPNMTSNSPNQGGSNPAPNTLSRPSGVFSDGSSLYVADQGNNRVLIYNPIPTSNNAAAAWVVGQATMTAYGSNQGGAAAANTLFFSGNFFSPFANPADVSVDSSTGRMFIADTVNNRVLLYLPSAVGTIGVAGGSVTLNSPLEPIQVQVQVPPGALAQAVNVTVGVLPNFPSALSSAGAVKTTGIGLNISLDQSIQPSGSVTMLVSYVPSDVAGLDRSKLILARYDDSDNLWTPLSSVSDTVNSRVIAQTNHFSTFQIMQVDPSNNAAANAKVFPNPFFPSQGQTAMTFSQVPPAARIRLYTLSGMLIKDFSADSTGIARWDGTNQSGVPVASGVYLAFIQGGGHDRLLRVALER